MSGRLTQMKQPAWASEEVRPVYHSPSTALTIFSASPLSLFLCSISAVQRQYLSLKELPTHLSHKLPMGIAPATQICMLGISNSWAWPTAGRSWRTTSEQSKPSSCSSVSREVSLIRSHLTTIPLSFFRVLILSQMCQGDVRYYKYISLSFYPDAPWFVIVLNSQWAHLLKCLDSGRKPLKASRKMNEDMNGWSTFIFTFKWIHTETCLWYSVICTFWSTILHKHRNSIISFQDIH